MKKNLFLLLTLTVGQLWLVSDTQAAVASSSTDDYGPLRIEATEDGELLLTNTGDEQVTVALTNRNGDIFFIQTLGPKEEATIPEKQKNNTHTLVYHGASDHGTLERSELLGVATSG